MTSLYNAGVSFFETLSGLANIITDNSQHLHVYGPSSPRQHQAMGMFDFQRYRGYCKGHKGFVVATFIVQTVMCRGIRPMRRKRAPLSKLDSIQTCCVYLVRHMLWHLQSRLWCSYSRGIETSSNTCFMLPVVLYSAQSSSTLKQNGVHTGCVLKNTVHLKHSCAHGLARYTLIQVAKDENKWHSDCGDCCNL